MIAEITSDNAWAFRFFFAIFAILLLPFASPLLSARLRNRMGLRWVAVTLVMLLVIVPASLALIAPMLLESHYIALQHKSTKFYVKLAAACDSLLRQHPTGTNEIIRIIGAGGAPTETNVIVWIPVKDPSLPKAIRDMHPLKLQVDRQRVWMLLDYEGHAGIGLEWQPKMGDTNVWVLDIVGEGLETVIYTSNRMVLPGIPVQPTSKTR